MKDGNAEIRALVVAVIVANHMMFDAEKLRLEMIPELFKQLAQPVPVAQSWLLCHFAEIVEFLVVRDLVTEENADKLRSFFKV